MEVWTGTWWAYDPTNDCPVGERHVAVGRGRDYADVPPVKGIYAGNAENTMRVVGAHDEDPLRAPGRAGAVLTRMRIWLPDAPGVLGAVAAEIGAVKGNVVGLEVLEREAGVAIDELVVELPDEPGAVEAVCRGVRNVPGAGVEEVTELLDGGAGPGGHRPRRRRRHPAGRHADGGHERADRAI